MGVSGVLILMCFAFPMMIMNKSNINEYKKAIKEKKIIHTSEHFKTKTYWKHDRLK